MDSYTTAFYEWCNAGTRNGLFDRALTEYYRDCPDQYSVTVGDTRCALPVLTRPEWLSPDVDANDIIGEYNHSPYSEFDMSCVESQVQRVAYGNGDMDPVVDDYLFNGDCLQPTTISETPLRIDVRDSDYFTKLTADERLMTELERHLYENDVQPTATQTAVRDVMTGADLPRRESRGHDVAAVVQSLPQRTAPFGVHAALVVNTGNGYELVVGRQAEDHMDAPGLLALVPKGGMETLDGSLDFEANVFKEYAEEALNADDQQGTMPDHPGLQQLYELMDAERAHLDFLGLSIGTGRLGVALSFLLLIDDPEYYEEHIRDWNYANKEITDIAQIPLDESGELETLLHPDQFVQSNLFAIFEGLQHLEREYGIAPDWDIERQTP